MGIGGIGPALDGIRYKLDRNVVDDIVQRNGVFISKFYEFDKDSLAVAGITAILMMEGRWKKGKKVENYRIFDRMLWVMNQYEHPIFVVGCVCYWADSENCKTWNLFCNFVKNYFARTECA